MEVSAECGNDCLFGRDPSNRGHFGRSRFGLWGKKILYFAVLVGCLWPALFEVGNLCVQLKVSPNGKWF
jgi:hypothetical protein